MLFQLAPILIIQRYGRNYLGRLNAAVAVQQSLVFLGNSTQEPQPTSGYQQADQIQRQGIDVRQPLRQQPDFVTERQLGTLQQPDQDIVLLQAGNLL